MNLTSNQEVARAETFLIDLCADDGFAAIETPTPLPGADANGEENTSTASPPERGVAKNIDLTLDIFAEDGSRTWFYQDDGVKVHKTLRQLLSPRLFSQPLLTLASEHSVSAVPTRTVDLILAHTESPPPLPLPPEWLDVVEVSGEAFLDYADAEAQLAAEGKRILLAEIHTLGDWMIRLKFVKKDSATIHEQRQVWAHFFDLPGIPFRLAAGGVGFINPMKISRVTVCPPFEGIPETALPLDLLQCIRS